MSRSPRPPRWGGEVERHVSVDPTSLDPGVRRFSCSTPSLAVRSGLTLLSDRPSRPASSESIGSLAFLMIVALVGFIASSIETTSGAAELKASEKPPSAEKSARIAILRGLIASKAGDGLPAGRAVPPVRCHRQGSTPVVRARRLMRLPRSSGRDSWTMVPWKNARMPHARRSLSPEYRAEAANSLIDENVRRN
jgi:hypothetical protein